MAGTLVVEQIVTSGYSYGAHLYSWNDAEIESMTGNTLTINWSNGVPFEFSQSYCLIENADQLPSGITDFNSDSGTGGTDTLDADINTLAGGYAVINAGGGNFGMGFTNNGTGWARKIDLALTIADGVIDDKLISADATPENANMSITGSNRHVMIAASFRRQE